MNEVVKKTKKEIKTKIDEQEKFIAEKYGANIFRFYQTHGMDKGICFDMLIFNAHCFMKGSTKEVISGGGAINVPDLIKDVKALDELKAKLK